MKARADEQFYKIFLPFSVALSTNTLLICCTGTFIPGRGQLYRPLIFLVFLVIGAHLADATVYFWRRLAKKEEKAAKNSTEETFCVHEKTSLGAVTLS
jgi:hypothetical protein